MFSYFSTLCLKGLKSTCVNLGVSKFFRFDRTQVGMYLVFRLKLFEFECSIFPSMVGLQMFYKWFSASEVLHCGIYC